MLGFNEYLEESRTLEGVEIHTERSKGYSDVHHVHLNGKHIASIHPMFTGIHSKDNYSVYKPPIKNPKPGQNEWANSHDEHGFGHPDHREEHKSEHERPNGKKGIFGGVKYSKVMVHKPKQYASLHQAVRAAVKTHKEKN